MKTLNLWILSVLALIHVNAVFADEPARYTMQLNGLPYVTLAVGECRSGVPLQGDVSAEPLQGDVSDGVILRVYVGQRDRVVCVAPAGSARLNTHHGERNLCQDSQDEGCARRPDIVRQIEDANGACVGAFIRAEISRRVMLANSPNPLVSSRSTEGAIFKRLPMNFDVSAANANLRQVCPRGGTDVERIRPAQRIRSAQIVEVLRRILGRSTTPADRELIGGGALRFDLGDGDILLLAPDAEGQLAFYFAGEAEEEHLPEEARGSSAETAVAAGVQKRQQEWQRESCNTLAVNFILQWERRQIGDSERSLRSAMPSSEQMQGVVDALDQGVAFSNVRQNARTLRSKGVSNAAVRNRAAATFARNLQRSLRPSSRGAHDVNATRARDVILEGIREFLPESEGYTVEVIGGEGAGSLSEFVESFRVRATKQEAGLKVVREYQLQMPERRGELVPIRAQIRFVPVETETRASVQLPGALDGEAEIVLHVDGSPAEEGLLRSIARQRVREGLNPSVARFMDLCIAEATEDARAVVENDEVRVPDNDEVVVPDNEANETPSADPAREESIDWTPPLRPE